MDLEPCGADFSPPWSNKFDPTSYEFICQRQAAGYWACPEGHRRGPAGAQSRCQRGLIANVALHQRGLPVRDAMGSAFVCTKSMSSE